MLPAYAACRITTNMLLGLDAVSELGSQSQCVIDCPMNASILCSTFKFLILILNFEHFQL